MNTHKAQITNEYDISSLGNSQYFIDGSKQWVAGLTSRDIINVSAQRTRARATDYGLIAACVLLASAGMPNDVLFAVLLATEARQVVLHAWPFWKTMHQTNFMENYTTPAFFISELCLFATLAYTPNSPVVSHLPLSVLAGHAAAHSIFAIISTVAPVWSVNQNVERVESSNTRSIYERSWATFLNAINATDFALHCLYSYFLATSISLPLALTASTTSVYLTATGLSRERPSHKLCALPRVVVVTGATGGIGLALCRQLSLSGCCVVVLARTQYAASLIASSLGSKSFGIECELLSATSVRAAAASIATAFPEGINALVCCAAVARWDCNGGDEDWCVNVHSQALLAAALMPTLRMNAHTSQSTVLFVGSSAAGWPGARETLHERLSSSTVPRTLLRMPWAHYAASKRALYGLTVAINTKEGGNVRAIAIDAGIAPSGLQRHMGISGKILATILRTIGFTCETAAQPLFDALCTRCEERICDADEVDGMERVWIACVNEATIKYHDITTSNTA